MDITILGIESSCDDTSAAVIRNTTLLSNVIASQAVHVKYGGVIPELASRAHQQNIIPVVDTALKEAGITADKFAQLITHGAVNADKVEVKFEAEDLKDNKVVNGATVEFVASNADTTVVDTVTYTVIVMGDANCDGINDVADSVALMNHSMQEYDLAVKFGEHALLAADMNFAQGIDVADAVLIMRKCMNDDYTSLLN